MSRAGPPASPAGGSGALFGPGRRGLLLGIVAVISLVAFEAMAVATAMPRAVADLHGLAFYAWAFSGYAVAGLFAMVVAGEMCDRRGPRMPLLGGVAVFTVGLLVAGTAADMAAFVAARALQGLGGGAVVVAIYVVVARAYDESLRPRVFAVMSSAWVLPAIIGPAVAGLVTDRWSWRWVFLADAALVVPAVLAMWRALPASNAVRADRRPGRKRAAAMVASGAACLQYAGQRLDLAGAAFAAAGLALVATGLPLLLPRGTMRFDRGLPTVIAMRGVLAGSFFGAEAFVPLMLVSQRNLSTTAAGLCLTGGAAGWAGGSAFQGRPGNTWPRYRLVRLGCLLVVVAITGVALAASAAVPPQLALVSWTVGGAGMGMAMASIAVLMLDLSPLADQGANSAAIQIADGLFSVVCIGIGGVVFAAAARSGTVGVWAFVLIDALMASLALLGVVVAGRVRPPPTLRRPAPWPPRAQRGP